MFDDSYRFFRASGALLVVLLLASLSLTSQFAAAQIVPVNLGGTTGYDGWNNMNRLGFPGYPGYPGSAVWPQPMGSNMAASGDAELQRLSGGTTTGGPFPAEDALYFGSFQQIPNDLGGSLRIEDRTPVSGVKTVVLQIQIGEAEGYDFHSPGGLPVLKINGQTIGRASMTPVSIDRFQNGTFFSPETEQEEPVYVNTWGFQWDVSALGSINSIQIDFSAVTHAQIYAMRLDQSSTTYTSSVFNATTDTRIIGLPASLDFGASPVGSTRTLTMTISNSGNSPLNVSGISYPPGFSGETGGSIIPSGGSRSVIVTFAPDAAGGFTGTIGVSSDATAGTGAVAAIGVGSAPSIRTHISGTPEYNGSVTAVSHTFISDPATWLDVEFTDNLADANSWTPHPEPLYSEGGVFSVTFTKPGDHRANWQRGMFFRLSYPTKP